MSETTIGPRERAVEALAEILAGAFLWRAPVSRRLRLWSEIPRALRPCCFLFEGGRESYVWNSGAKPRRVITVQVFVYVDASPGDRRGSGGAGACALNQIMDALDAALAPIGADAALGRLTLGGAAHQCRIQGAPFKDPGDLDGDGILVAPIEIVLP